MTPSPPAPVTIHEAVRAMDGSGAVYRGAQITRAQAIARRQTGGDVVVCGSDPFAVAREAFAIESANGPCFPGGPHVLSAGPQALPHFQARTRRAGDTGHTFYETPVRKAVPQP